MSKAPRILVMLVGSLATLAAFFGLYYNGTSIVTAILGGFADLDAQQRLTHFYPAFYGMSAICVVCYILLLVLGIDLLRMRLRWSLLLSGVLLFEVGYFFSVGMLWLVPGIGTSIAAATGVANGGLMPQFMIFFPLWAPLALWWARRKLEPEKPTS